MWLQLWLIVMHLSFQNHGALKFTLHYYFCTVKIFQWNTQVRPYASNTMCYSLTLCKCYSLYVCLSRAYFKINISVCKRYCCWRSIVVKCSIEINQHGDTGITGELQRLMITGPKRHCALFKEGHFKTSLVKYRQMMSVS